MISSGKEQVLQNFGASLEVLADEKNVLTALGRVAVTAADVLNCPLTAVLVLGVDSGTGYLVTNNLKPGLSPVVLDPALLASSASLHEEDYVHKAIDKNDPTYELLAAVLHLPRISCMSRHKFSLGKRLNGILVTGEDTQSSPPSESDWQCRFTCFAHVFALALRDNPLLSRMKEQTHRMRPNTPARSMGTDMLLRYKEFFESLSGGAFIVDANGKVVFLNHEAEVLTGYSSDWLVGRRILEVVAQPHRNGFLEILKRTQAGESLKSFDVDLETTSGDLICVNMAVAQISGDDPLVALTFRDITETRVVEQELLKTKEFFERIIQSTVDAIVCSDNEGLLTLFNAGAERLFGYAAENVVQNVQLSELFPGKEGTNVMQTLHSPQRGGLGRLEPIRVEVLARDGERVPVQLTASLIYDEDQAVGVVAIMTDLRERMRMERRYQEIQDQYLNTQKQALVAELAGTTAHELNQPLTSIMGYAEILDRRIEENSPNRRAVETIISEAERMAEIVKKIGKITRYETKTYVGSTQILDLDKSSDQEE